MLWFDQNDDYDTNTNPNPNTNINPANPWDVSPSSTLYTLIQHNNMALSTQMNANHWSRPHTSLHCSRYYVPDRTTQWSDADR